MKTQVKSISSAIWIIVLMFLFAGFTWNQNKHNEQEHQLILEILSEEDHVFSELDLEVLKDKVIVLDKEGNMVLNKLYQDIENGKMSVDESMILFNADFLMENLGNEIYIQN